MYKINILGIHVGIWLLFMSYVHLKWCAGNFAGRCGLWCGRGLHLCGLRAVAVSKTAVSAGCSAVVGRPLRAVAGSKLAVRGGCGLRTSARAVSIYMTEIDMEFV